MFASSVEKVQSQGKPELHHASQQSMPGAKGFGVVGQKGFGKSMAKDSWATWSPNEDAAYDSWVVGQKRSWSQSQIQGWSPPAKQQTFAPMHNAHFDQGYDFQLPAAIDEYALIGFVHEWGLNDDAVNKLKSLAPAVRFKVFNEFK